MRYMWDRGGLFEKLDHGKRVRNMNIALEDAEMGAVELHTAYSFIPPGCPLRQ
jgi:hypothetical protein